MASFILRAIDDNVWAKVKSKAAQERISLKDLAVEMFTEYAEKPARKPRKKD